MTAVVNKAGTKWLNRQTWTYRPMNEAMIDTTIISVEAESHDLILGGASVAAKAIGTAGCCRSTIISVRELLAPAGSIRQYAFLMELDLAFVERRL